jgi:arylsulfatase A-like enzyme
VRWPGKVPAATVSTETICHVDFMATVAALLNAQLPDNAAEDSVNILPALLGQKHVAPLREATVHHGSRGHLAIRKGDWVLIDAPSGQENSPQAGEPDWLKRQRGYEPHEHPGELYNLREDLIQSKNRYGQRPEIVRELTALLQKYIRDGRSTPGQPQRNDIPWDR